MDRKNRKDWDERREREQEIIRESRRTRRPAGYYSNQIIRERNGGVRHQFEDDIGGCSANYK